MTGEILSQFFPSPDAIPAGQRLPAPIHQTTWLVDGELKTWGGKRKTVLSPVGVRRTQRGTGGFLFANRKEVAERTLSVADALRAFSIRSMVAAKQTSANGDLLDAIVVEHKSRNINTRFIF